MRTERGKMMNCQHCNKAYVAQRFSSKWCSESCKQLAKRGRAVRPESLYSR